jgi:TonB family protein
MTMLSLLLGGTIKISVIVLGALVATQSRQRSAAFRHWVLASAILCAAATPLLELVVPSWDVRPADAPSVVLATLRDQLVVPGRAPSPRAFPLPGVGQIAVSLWASGFALSLGLLVAGVVRVTWLASRAQRVVDGQWTRQVAELCRRYRIRRRVLLLQSDHPTLLVTWGVVRPTIVLPAAARHWSELRARIVLGHELAHVQRYDWVVQMAGELLRAVYWFNPLVWIACRRLRRESEHACDDAVLNLGVEGTEYAIQLVDLARAFSACRRTWLPDSAAAAMARPSSLERRVRAMLNAHLNRRPITRSACVATAIVVLGLTLPLAGLGAAPQTGPATFSGTLLDTIGRILPDVPMTLTNVESGRKYDAHSDASGHFVFAGLTAGDYELDAPMPGFATRYRLTVKAGQRLQELVTLQLGSITETITVTPSPAARAKTFVGDFPPLRRDPGPCDQSPTGGCIEPPTKIGDVRPQYPQNQRDVEAIVVLEGRIGTDGRVKRLRVLAPAEPDFANAALEAVNEWRFTPTFLDGVAVEVDMRVTVNFKTQ